MIRVPFQHAFRQPRTAGPAEGPTGVDSGRDARLPRAVTEHRDIAPAGGPLLL